MSAYRGRHRPPKKTSILPAALASGNAMPAAAAATLVVCAVGATAAQSSATAAGSPTGGMNAAAMGAQPATVLPKASDDARRQLAESSADRASLSERRQESTVQTAAFHGREAVRAARSKERAALARAKSKTAGTPAPAGTSGNAGTNAAAPATTQSGWVMPVLGAPVTSGFGYRWGRMHEGLDFGAAEGTPLYAMSGGGRVTYAGWMDGYGNCTDITYPDGTMIRYAHQSRIDVTVGQTVQAGPVVGAVGNTGRSFGAHLHVEVHPGGAGAIDPYGWLLQKGIL